MAFVCLNFGAVKTEAVLALRGVGAKSVRRTLATDGGILVGGFVARVVGAYNHFGTMVVSRDCPAQGAARRITLATSAYSRNSGHFLLS